MIPSALRFTNGQTQVVVHPNTGTDPTIGSFFAWLAFPDLSVNSFRYFDKTSSGAVGFWRLQGGGGATTGALRCLVDYSTTNADSTTANGSITTAIPYFVACTFDGTTAPKIYIGTLDVPVSEASYQATSAPSGSRVSDGGSSEYIGAAKGSTAATSEYWLYRWTPGIAFTLNDLRAFQFRPMTSRNYPGFLCVAAANGNGDVMDLSGNRWHGAMTGTPARSDVLPRVSLR